MKAVIIALSLISLPALAAQPRYPTVESAIKETRYQAHHCGSNAIRSFEYGIGDGGQDREEAQERFSRHDNQCNRVEEMRMKELAPLLKEEKSKAKLEGALALKRATKELILEKEKRCVLDVFEKGVDGDIGGDAAYEVNEHSGYSTCHLVAKQRLDRLKAGHLNAATTAEVSHDISAEKLLEQIDKTPAPAAAEAAVLE